MPLRNRTLLWPSPMFSGEAHHPLVSGIIRLSIEIPSIVVSAEGIDTAPVGRGGTRLAYDRQGYQNHPTTLALSLPSCAKIATVRLDTWTSTGGPEG